MRLFIAEKPSVAEAIAKQICPSPQKKQHHYDCGDDRVTWCFGHLLSTATPEDYDASLSAWSLEALPIVPEKWRLIPNKATSSHLQAMKLMLQEASVIVHSGDPDREGQLVVDEILNFFNIRKKTERLWLNSIDPESVKKSLKSLEPNSKYEGFMKSALGRQRADWLIGLNLSRLYTKVWEKMGGERLTLTVGRVQTPTLALVVERDRLISEFKSHDFFSLKMTFKETGGQGVDVKWVKNRAEKSVPPGRLDSEGRIIQRSFLEGIATELSGAEALVESVIGEEKLENAPLPYSLSELQKDANNAFGYSPKEVLEGCQTLYEKHTLTTYPRTDCGYLKESQHPEAPEVMAAVKGNLYGVFEFPDEIDLSLKSKAWNDKKVTAHHGIIPTACKAKMSDLSVKERNLYELIVRRYITQFMRPHEFIAMKVVVVSGSHEFEATARVVTVVGWKAIQGMEESEDEEAPAVDIDEGVKGKLLTPVVKKSVTKAPPRFTGALLIDAMKNIHRFVTDESVKGRLKENEGIGTEATRADIIDGLITKGYLEERKNGKKREYHATVIGQLLIGFVPAIFASPELTAFLEVQLSDVESEKIKLSNVEEVMVRIVLAAVEDGKEGIGMNKINPAMLPAHFKEAIVENKRKAAERKAAAEKRRSEKKPARPPKK